MVRLAASFVLVAVALLPQPARAQTPAATAPPIIALDERVLPVLATGGMVASQEARATRIGVDILARGGNAVDAAVAVGFALAVTLPRAGSLGGGGFMVIHRADSGTTAALDYRETAPAAATPDMFLDAAGTAIPALSRDGGAGIGVPGVPAGLATALDRHGSGRFTLADLIAPAITLARDGIPVEADLADSLPRARARLSRFPATARIFLPEGRDLRHGDRLVQGDLADTLAIIAARGPAGFYEGPVAERIAAAVRAEGGRMTAADLAAYRPVWRDPVRTTYRGHDCDLDAAPILGRCPSRPDAQHAGAMGSAHLRRRKRRDAASHDRGDEARLRGPCPMAGRSRFRPRARRWPDVPPLCRYARRRDRSRSGQAVPGHRRRERARLRATETTHFSVVDRFGNAVAVTTTINFSYGVGLVAEGTGVLLNNQLDDLPPAPMPRMRMG